MSFAKPKKSMDNTAMGKTVTVSQVKSAAGAKPGMLPTLIGLGLGRIGKVSTIADTDSTRGMITKVRHLIKVEG